MLSRRGLFGVFGAAVAGAALDPERLLWIPGSKVISVPAAPNVAGQANAANLRLAWAQDWQLLTLENELMMAKLHRGAYGDTWFSHAPKIGDTLFLKRPPQFGIAGIATSWRKF